jgi:DNA-binding response OmpR family regulator
MGPTANAPEQSTVGRKHSLHDRACILSVGYLTDQLQKRNQKLQEAGFIVDAASDPHQALQKASAEYYDCAVFGIAVPDSIRNDIAAGVRKRNRDAVVIVLYWASTRNTE